MLVKYFDEFSSSEHINEYVNYDDVKFNNKSKIDIYKGFEKLGYSKCLGIFTWKYNYFGGYVFKPIMDFLQTNLFDFADEISEGHFNLKKDLDDINAEKFKIECYSPNYELDRKGYKDSSINELFKTIGEENVVRINDRQKKDNHEIEYCVFWNPIKKYFYFIRLNNETTDVKKLLDYYITLKTEKKAFDILKKEFIEEKEERIKQEKKEEEKKYWDKKSEEYYDMLKKDYETNKEKYKEVEYEKNLPENVKETFGNSFKDNYEHDGYFETYIVLDKNPYDVETRVYIVNNKDFTDGYYYTARVDTAPRGTYWGD